MNNPILNQSSTAATKTSIAELCVDASTKFTGPVHASPNSLSCISRSFFQILSAEALITFLYWASGATLCSCARLRMKMPLNWVEFSSHESGSQDSWITLEVELVNVVMAALAMWEAEVR